MELDASELDEILCSLEILSYEYRPTAKSKRWCVTYKGDIPEDTIRELITKVMVSRAPSNNSILDMHITTAPATKLFPYLHTHALASFEYSIRIQSPQVFNIEYNVPKIRTIGTMALWSRCVQCISSVERSITPTVAVETPLYISNLKLVRDPSLPTLKSAYASTRMYLDYTLCIDRTDIHDWWQDYITTKDSLTKIAVLEHSTRDGHTYVALMLSKPLRIRCTVKKLEINGISPVMRSVVSDKQWNLCVSYIKGDNSSLNYIQSSSEQYKDAVYGVPFTPIVPQVFTLWQKQLHEHMRSLIDADPIREKLIQEIQELSGSNDVVIALKNMQTKVTIIYTNTRASGRTSFATAYKNAYPNECWNCESSSLTGSLYASADTEFRRGWSGQTVICDLHDNILPSDVYVQLRCLREGRIPDPSKKRYNVFRPVCVVVMTSCSSFLKVAEEEDWDLYYVDDLQSGLAREHLHKEEFPKPRPPSSKSQRIRPINVFTKPNTNI